MGERRVDDEDTLNVVLLCGLRGELHAAASTKRCFGPCCAVLSLLRLYNGLSCKLFGGWLCGE